jgi:cell migration-inducing and hyaluronan-binding protein
MQPLSKLLALAALVAAFAACSADPATNNPVGVVVPPTVGADGTWSSPTTWGGEVPKDGANVVIPAGKKIVLEGTTANLKSLVIEGELVAGDKDIAITSGSILVKGGKLTIGTAAYPYLKRATITLTGANTGADSAGCGEKFLCVTMNGTLSLYGEARESWTRIQGTLSKGATTMTLSSPVKWRAGDRIVIASTDFDMNQAEEVTVSSAGGTTLTFAPALKYAHFGEVQTFDGKSVDSRAEVALVNRNITVQGDAASSTDGFGGHIMVMGGGVANVSDVELTRMGQEGILKRYAIHYHLLFDDGAKSSMTRMSIHHTFNRCMTIHGTNKLQIKQNTCYDNIGHAFFIEDGAETENQFIENLGLLTRAPKPGKAVLKADAENVATYWITNPRNTFRGNVAAGSDGFGYWFSMPNNVGGAVGAARPNEFPSPLSEWKTDFVDNSAHSSSAGFFQDNCLKDDGGTQTCYYNPIQQQAEALGVDPKPSDARLRVTFGKFTAYKTGLGIWNRAFYQRFEDVRLADNAEGMILACNECEVNGGVIAGETANKGNPKPGERTGPFGHSLVNPGAREYEQRVVGFRFYDESVHLKNITFASFKPGKLSDGTPRPETAAISSNTTYAGGHTTQGIRFVDMPVGARFGRGYGGGQFSFEDLDGSVVGFPATVLNYGVGSMTGSNCSVRPEWNWYGNDPATVCPRSGNTYRYVDLWWYGVDEFPGGNAPQSVTRTGGGTFTRDYEGRLRFDLSTSARITFKNGAMSPGTRLNFAHLQPGDEFKLEIPYNASPVSVVFGGAYFGPLQNLKTTVNPASSRGAMTSNTYFYDAAAKTLYLQLKPHYMDYAFNEGQANLTIQ